MSEIIKKRVKENLGKEAKIFLHNGFRFAGELTDIDDVFIELNDKKSGAIKIIQIIDIKDMEIQW